MSSKPNSSRETVPLSCGFSLKDSFPPRLLRLSMCIATALARAPFKIRSWFFLEGTYQTFMNVGILANFLTVFQRAPTMLCREKICSRVAPFQRIFNYRRQCIWKVDSDILQAETFYGNFTGLRFFPVCFPSSDVCSYFPKRDWITYNFQTLPKHMIKLCISLSRHSVHNAEKSCLRPNPKSLTGG